MSRNASLFAAKDNMLFYAAFYAAKEQNVTVCIVFLLIIPKSYVYDLKCRNF